MVAQAAGSRAKRDSERVTLALWIVGIGIGTCAYAWRVTVPERAGALTSVLFEIMLWTLILLTVMERHPRHEVRMSEPTLSVLGWMFYYFIKPGLTWLQGVRFAYESSSTVFLDPDLVSRVQYLHMIYMGGFFTVYLLLAPRIALAAGTPTASSPATDDDRKLPTVWFFLGLGLFPYVSEAVTRVVTTGSILPTRSYGASTSEAFDALSESRYVGGSDYFLTQILSKIWYVPLLALGLGYGVMLARFVKTKRWTMAAIFFAHVPLLFLLGPGSRSYTVFPLLLAVMIADMIAGPFKWRYFLMAVAAGLPLLDLYGVFRGHQDLALREAYSATQDSLVLQGDMANTEDSTMLVKEAFCVLYAEHTRNFLGIDYFIDNFLAVIPSQFVADKARLWNTANFLSDAFLGGAAAQGSGTAGASVGDGYLVGGEFGVFSVAGTYGAILAAVMRFGTSAGGTRVGPVAWRYYLAIFFTVQSNQFIRSDLCVTLTYVLYYVLFPGLVFAAIGPSLVPPKSFWLQRLPLLGRAT